MKQRFILLFAAILILSACEENTPVQTVEWYKTHDSERDDMLAKCESNPGELEGSANCINAKQARNQKAGARRGWIDPTQG